MKKINHLTAEQEARLPAIRNKWLGLGLSCEPADRAEAEAGVREAYEKAGLKPPRYIIWLGSPYEGAIGAAFLAPGKQTKVWDQVGAQVRDQVGAQVWAQVGAQVRDQVGAQVRDQVGAQVWAQVRAQVRAQVWAQVGAQVGAQVRAQVWDQVWDQVGAQVGAQVGDQVWRCGYGQHDAGWLGFYEAFDFIPEVARLSGVMKISRNAGWWWPFENFCILTERPCHLARDAQNRLHCEDRAAIEYRDGWGVYAWHGVRVPDLVILHPEQITAKMIEGERNAEIRRIMIERYGLARYLKDSGAIIIDHEEGIGTLYRKDEPEDEPIYMVEVVNSTPEADGSWKRYFLDVSSAGNSSPGLVDDRPTMKEAITARAAVAATFGLKASEYRPAVET